MRYRIIKKALYYSLNRLSQHFLIPYIDGIRKIKWLKLLHILNIGLKTGLITLLGLKGQKEPNIFVMGRDYVNWAVDRSYEDTKLLLRKSRAKITNNILKATHIYCVWYDYILRDEYQWLYTLKRVLNHKIMVVVTNDIRNYEWKINKYRNFVDLWIVPSTNIYNYLCRFDLRAYIIPTYLRNESFKLIKKTKKEICIELNLDYEKIKSKIVIGSFQRDSSKDLLTPKWQKNPDLLINILKSIPRGTYILLLAGPRRHYIINQCIKNEIPYIFYGDMEYIKSKRDDVLVNNQPINKINLLYNLSDVYIVSSRIEGGPLAILEASITKTLIFSTDVGFAKDFIHKDLIYSELNIEKVTEFLSYYSKNKALIEEYIAFNYTKVNNTFMESNYIKYFENLIKILKEKPNKKDL